MAFCYAFRAHSDAFSLRCGFGCFYAHEPTTVGCPPFVSNEATEKINGKPLLAEGVVDSIADLTKKAGLQSNVKIMSPTRFEQLAFWITALAPLLLRRFWSVSWNSRFPGVMWPGIISAICFALFSWVIISRRARRLGCRRALRSRNGAGIDRDTFLRAQSFWIVGVFII